MDLKSIVHVCLAGLSTGMFIWLVASGLTLIFGVLGVLNFAHGSFYMLGAYCCFTVLSRLGDNFWLGLLFGWLPAIAAANFVERAWPLLLVSAAAAVAWRLMG